MLFNNKFTVSLYKRRKNNSVFDTEKGISTFSHHENETSIDITILVEYDIKQFQVKAFLLHNNNLMVITVDLYIVVQCQFQ